MGQGQGFGVSLCCCPTSRYINFQNQLPFSMKNTQDSPPPPPSSQKIDNYHEGQHFEILILIH